MEDIQRNKIIYESSVAFGSFPIEQFFYIEKSDAFQALGEGFSTVEFVYLRNGSQLCFIEAKSSSPRTDNSPENFETYIHDITTKFEDSYQLFLAVHCERRTDHKMGKEIRLKTIPELNVKFILVIPGHDEKWLPPIQDALKRSLRKVSKIWNISIAVMNQQMAADYGLLVNE